MAESPPSTTTLAVAPRRILSAELHALNQRFGHGEVQVGEVLEVMGARAYSLLLVLLALPFLTPVSLLGISTVVGAVIGYLGLRLALGLRPHLPARLRERRLPPRFFGLLLRGAERIIRLLERITRKRLPFFVSGILAHRLVGAGIVAAALLLMLPLPIPLSNALPAIAIVALALGRLEDDGGMVLLGFAVLLLAAVFFAFLGFFGFEVMQFLHQWYGAHFGALPPGVPPTAPTPAP